MLEDKSIKRAGNPPLVVRIEQKLYEIIGAPKRTKIDRDLRSEITNEGFSIICSNCIGGKIYHSLGREFLSPTINMAFDGPDFIRFVMNLEKYINEELVENVSGEVDYPVGRLDDVEIQFVHYKTFEEAKKKWEERKQRINFSNLYVIATDRDGMGNEECMKAFDKLPYKKIMYTSKEYPEYEWSCYCSKWKHHYQVGVMTGYAGITGKYYYEAYADLVRFFNS